MFKSKHSGWTWDLKRTPFGGGGGDFFSGIGEVLASIDPGPAIGSGLASVDQAVNQIPGGWITVAGLAAGGAALAYAPEVIALAASEGIAPEAAAISLGSAPIDVATGATVPLSELGSLAPSVSGEIAPLTTGSGFGLTGAAAPAGSAGAAGGMSAQLAPGTILGTGLEGGGAIGSSYAAGANGLPATDFFGNYVPASSVNFGGVPNTIAGTTATTTNTDLAKLLKQGAGSGLSKSLGQLAQGSNSQGQALSPWVHGNQNPFTQTAQQPIQNAPKLDLASLASLLKQG